MPSTSARLAYMADLAKALGKTTDAADYTRREATALSSFTKVLYDEERSLYRDGEAPTTARCTPISSPRLRPRASGEPRGDHAMAHRSRHGLLRLRRAIPPRRALRKRRRIRRPRRS